MTRFFSAGLAGLMGLTLACGGSSSSRQLQSIAIHSAVNGQQIQFTAAGTFSAPPTTVDPLPVNWSLGLFAPPPANLQYTLTSQPYLVNCVDEEVNGPAQISAFAPKNPSATMEGTVAFAQGVAAAMTFTCP